MASFKKNQDTRFAPNLIQNFRKYKQKSALPIYIPLPKIDANNITDIRI